MRKACDITSIDSTEGLGSLFALYRIATFQPARSALDTAPFRPPEILDDSGKLKLYRIRVKKTNQVEQYVGRKRSRNHSACYYQAKTSSLLLSTHLDRSPGATSGVQAWQTVNQSRVILDCETTHPQTHTSSPQSFGLKQNLVNTTLRCQGTPFKIRVHQSISLYHF